MFIVDEDTFESMVSKAIDAIPPKYFTELKNVVFVAEDEPTAEQRTKLRLRGHESLFGLYEGIPITKRASGYNLALPDKITIFRGPTMFAVNSHDQLQALVDKTVWHEVAHYFGLDHDAIHALEEKPKE